MGNHHSFQSPARQGTPSTSLASPARASRPAPLTALERAEQSRGEGPDLRTLPLSPPARQNTTGLPDTLKAGLEGLSGLSMDEVHVHYHSPYPARLRAHAYTRGTHIYMGQGQEKHLAHEAWHVVQQMQGRVKPTTRVAATKVNDDEALEREADRQGQRASTFPAPTFSAHRHLSGPLADPQSVTSPPT
ncbi:MAG TPA: DUF4157 domain-containing protein, partial [Ktedonobacteraceae bacterium]|nr:DUF4157 domain-containing protein [Ktedonobacteraceae bacterium]